VSLLAGIFEIMAAIAVLVKPVRPLIVVFLIWKMGSELFYPHFEIFEWVERGGSYGTLIALWICLDPGYKTEDSFTKQRTFSVDQ
jgi:hypothetical protein